MKAEFVFSSIQSGFCCCRFIWSISSSFISYTSLVLGWTPFCTDSARCWKHYSKVLVRVDVIVLFKWISWYQSVPKKIHLHHL